MMTRLMAPPRLRQDAAAAAIFEILVTTKRTIAMASLPVDAGSDDPHNAAVTGTNNNGGWGVTGRSAAGVGVSGESQSLIGVSGVTHDSNNAGVLGTNTGGGWGVTGRSDGATGTGVSGESADGVGVHGKGGRLAGRFDGPVDVNGGLFVDGAVTISKNGDLVLQGADCAERFDILGAAAPGDVVVIGAAGALEPCRTAYDRCVAGVISGAGSYRPGILLDAGDGGAGRLPVALVGKVFCRVDADAAPIEIGDMLTTSTTPGHAMKAVDPSRGFGALLGKALASLPAGKGLIPVLVALQ